MNVGSYLCVPISKVLEIMQQSSTEKCLAVGDYWVNTDPDASWERLARALYLSQEVKALAVVKQYLQQGICVVLDYLKSVFTFFLLVLTDLLSLGGFDVINKIPQFTQFWFKHQSMFQVININISSPSHCFR